MSSGQRPQVGAQTRLVSTKWPDRPHWTYPALYLGCDTFGDWFGHPVGTVYTRPGATMVGPNEMVTLVPAVDFSGLGTPEPWGRSFLASFHDEHSGLECYVDVTTEPRWQGAEVWAVDLDLDVVRRRESPHQPDDPGPIDPGPIDPVLIDDEDEFAAHQVEFGYPADVVTAARRTADALAAAVRGRRPPFDGPTAVGWLAVLTALTGTPNDGSDEERRQPR